MNAMLAEVLAVAIFNHPYVVHCKPEFSAAVKHCHKTTDKIQWTVKFSAYML
jgi:hypothetical protein